MKKSSKDARSKEERKKEVIKTADKVERKVVGTKVNGNWKKKIRTNREIMKDRKGVTDIERLRTNKLRQTDRQTETEI